MNRRTYLTTLIVVLLCALNTFGLGGSPRLTSARPTSLSSILNGDTDRDRDGLSGPVRRVKTEMTKLTNRGGKSVEGQRVLIEAVAYDIKGAKIENAYYPVPGTSLTGKEVYKYDEKGNIVEMTMVNADGSLLSKEVYSYELDAFGNWIKMTTSIAVIEGGKIIFEPTEVTYRSISYYLDEAALARMSQPATPAAPNSQQLLASAAQVVPASSNKPQTDAASRPSIPLPGAALLKSNIAVPDGGFSSPSGAAVNETAVKVDGEAPPPAPLKAQPKPLLKPISGGVLNGKAMSLPKPVYPQAAKTARASGLVSVEVVIDENGKVIAAKAVEGHALLRGAAMAAAQSARFSPTLLSGQPVKVSGQINYTFTLQ